MALKTLRIRYLSKNLTTGLADVEAEVFKNGSLVNSDVALSQVDAVNSPGLYELVLNDASLAGAPYSAVAGDQFTFYVDSASQPAAAVAVRTLTEKDLDDLSGEVATVDANVDTILAEVQDGTYGLSALNDNDTAILSAVQSIQNNTNFSAVLPAQSLIPGAGSNTYRIAINIYDTSGNLEDPDSNQVKVSITNQAGVDRTSLLAGYVAGPVDAIRDSLGQYRIDYSIASTDAEEQLLVKFDYDESAVQKVHNRTTEVLTEVDAAGGALEATSQDILADTADMQPRVPVIETAVTSGSHGNAALKVLIDAIQSNLNNGTDGLSALKALVDAVQSTLDDGSDGLVVINAAVAANAAELANGTYGLSAIKSKIDTTSFTGGVAV